MKPIISLLLLFKISEMLLAQSPCAPIILPQFSETVKQKLEHNLFLAKENLVKDPADADAIIWYGRRTAYLGNYLQAISIFSEGIKLHPNDARFFRHRGHRYLTVRCFDKAISDFEKAAQLINAKTDEIEPDGMPNEKNIPTSTLQSNIWYHLGLAHYLKGDYESALKAYKKCLKVSTNNDMYVATFYWYYNTLRQLGINNKFFRKDAQKQLSKLNADIELIENKDYLDILLLYRNKNDSLFFEKTKSQVALSNATLSFGLGNYYLINGEVQKAKEVFEKIVRGNQWASFGFIVAETTILKLK
ncbi:MAG: tetratricopeptide repeat protein [Chitinophagaceae bacterium]|nr:MAG: tetratricopeptide repeat protein [Chitinophagaceae bacterium]